MRTVIFDLDGTLADTSADLIGAANARFDALGLGAPLDPVADRLVAFQGGRAMLRLGYDRLRLTPDPGEADHDYAALLEFYAETLDRETRFYPGAIEAVEALRAAGVAVGICTNKPVGLAEDLMRRLGARHLFASLIGAGTLPVRKPDPAPLLEAVRRASGDPRRAVLIGDTQTDRDTGRAANVPVVLVTFGPEGRGVERMGAEAYLDDYRGLGCVVDGLLGVD